MSIEAVEPSAAEWDPTWGTAKSGIFKISRTGSSTEFSLFVNYTVGGTADEGIDYNEFNPLSSPIEIMPWSSEAYIYIDPKPDTIDEDDETVTLELVGGSGYTVDPSAFSATVTIADTPTPVVSIEAVEPNAAEWDPTWGTAKSGIFKISRAGSSTEFSLFVNYTVGGDADEGIDYNEFNPLSSPIEIMPWSSEAYIYIDPKPDTIDEDDETVTLELVGGSGYTVDPSAFSATVTIADTPTPVVSIEAVEPNAAEWDPTWGTAKSGIFKISRTGSSTEFSLFVNYTVSGTADEGIDYNEFNPLSNPVEIAPWSSEAYIYIDPKPDTLDEDDETVTLELTSGAGYTADPSASSATVTIADTPIPTVIIEAVEPNAAEWDPTWGTAKSGIFKISRMGSSTEFSLFVNYTVGGTADEGIDYNEFNPLSSPIEIMPWSSESYIYIDPVPDGDTTEGTETVTLTLLDGADYDLEPGPSLHIATVNITDTPLMDTTDSFGVGWEGGTLDFFLTAITPVGDIASYEVDVDNDGTFDVSSFEHDAIIDGALIFEAAVLHLLGTPVEDGAYTGTLRVHNTGGFYNDSEIPIIVGNVPPDIQISHPDYVDPGTVYTLTVATSDPGPDTITELTIDWGDGSAIETFAVSAGAFDHIYSTAGQYTAIITVTDEDTTNKIEWIIDIGEISLPIAPNTDPVITFSYATILASGEAELTIEAEDAAGNPIVSSTAYEWDLNGDGDFGDATGQIVLIVPDAGVYIATVRISDGAGNVTEALFAFLGGGPVEGEPTIGNFSQRFRKVTPEMPGDWHVHHRLQVGRVTNEADEVIEQILAKRFLRERDGYNVHKLENLRAVPPEVHYEIGKREKNWWRRKAGEMGFGDDVHRAMREVNLAEYEQFVTTKLDPVYEKWWITHGNGTVDRAKVRNVSRILNGLRGERSLFVVQKASRARQLGMIVGSIALFDLIGRHAAAANNIRSHTPEQLAKWNEFITAYETALEQSIDLGRVKLDAGINVHQAFIAYATELGLTGDALNRVDAEIGKWVAANLEP